MWFMKVTWWGFWRWYEGPWLLHLRDCFLLCICPCLVQDQMKNVTLDMVHINKTLINYFKTCIWNPNRTPPSTPATSSSSFPNSCAVFRAIQHHKKASGLGVLWVARIIKGNRQPWWRIIYMEECEDELGSYIDLSHRTSSTTSRTPHISSISSLLKIKTFWTSSRAVLGTYHEAPRTETPIEIPIPIAEYT